MTAFMLFVAGLVAFVVALLRKVAGQTAAEDRAEKERQQAQKAVESAKLNVEVAEADARLVQESVSARLAKLDDEDAAAREKAAVDVANDIIGRN